MTALSYGPDIGLCKKLLFRHVDAMLTGEAYDDLLEFLEGRFRVEDV